MKENPQSRNEDDRAALSARLADAVRREWMALENKLEARDKAGEDAEDTPNPPDQPDIVSVSHNQDAESPLAISVHTTLNPSRGDDVETEPTDDKATEELEPESSQDDKADAADATDKTPEVRAAQPTETSQTQVTDEEVTDEETSEVSETPSEEASDTETPKPRAKRGARIAAVAACAVVALLGVGAAFTWWQVARLDDALAFDDTVEPVTVQADQASAPLAKEEGETVVKEAKSQRQRVQETLVEPATGEPFYLLVIGSDSREGGVLAHEDEIERSDTMILVRIDPEEKLITMVSVPRDTPYTFEDGGVAKINDTFHEGGAAATVKAVAELTGVDIAHVVCIGFSDLAAIVDGLGGVEVNVDTRLSYRDALTGETVTLQPGTQVINGQQAQIFARARQEYDADQDGHRQNNIRQLGLAIIRKVLDKPLYALYPTILDLAGYVDTDLTTLDIASLAMAFAGDLDSMTVYECAGPREGDFNADHAGMWLCYENPEGWQALMDVVEAGEDPSAIQDELEYMSEFARSQKVTNGLAYYDYDGVFVDMDQDNDGWLDEEYGGPPDTTYLEETPLSAPIY